MCRRMQQVLAADKSLTKAMSLVDKVAVKDIVLLHCASLRARHNKSRASFITASMACDSNEEYCASEDELPGGEALCRTRSSEAVAAEASATSIDRKLATAMVACLVGEGNCGRCSVWQLNQFLDAFLPLYQNGYAQGSPLYVSTLNLTLIPCTEHSLTWTTLLPQRKEFCSNHDQTMSWCIVH